MSGATTAPLGAITNGRILKIALPIVLSNITVPILGAVDTAVVGQLGEAAPIGAVGLGAIILSSVYWIFGFLRMGTVGLTSQALGAGNRGEVAALLSRALLIGLVAGLALIALQAPIFWAAFRVAPGSAEVETLASGYLRLRIWSAPAAIAIYGISGWLIAQERTRAVLILQLWMNGLNVALDLVFVFGLGWGVEGVAFATFLAEWTGLALGLWLCRNGFAGRDWRNPALVFDRDRLAHMMSVNTDILIRSLLLQAMFVGFLFIGAGFGDVTLAANQVLMQFLSFTSFALDGFAFTAETLVGQALGARARDRLREAAVKSSAWGLIIVALLALVFGLFGGAIIDLMTTAPEVRARARDFLPYLVVMPVAGVGAFMLDGIFIGATASRDMRNMMAVSFVIYVIAVAVLVPLWANHGLWLALLIAFLARGITLGLRYPGLEARAAG
ncbi:MATE family efflux transporter [Pseudodonghicola xiamenensis]|uniref:MATE family efflux transporter n=1 Tax=Pseudodonghicola xiamenensis TaxID=337702 RepID=A0A8J3H9I1_9RHOB|nr:MATE family efflux transporter [Pseudodonghicola xiamenensis]GHG97479.1 MATE family efflux transporter [Pseudodonghicola xiamenensis]